MVIGREAGLTDEDIRAIAVGPSAAGLSAGDRLLLTATDEQVTDKFVSDKTWSALSQRWEIQQLMDLVFAIGQYTLVSMALNTFGVQLEEGAEEFPPELFQGGRFPASVEVELGTRLTIPDVAKSSSSRSL